MDESEIMDSKLKNLNKVYENKNVHKDSFEEEKKEMNLDSFYTSYAEHNTLPRYRLPCIPTVIKVS